MPAITTADVELIDRKDEGVYEGDDGFSYSPFQMDRYVIEAQVKEKTLYRMLPNSSRPLWDSQQPEFIEQLKTLFISQYIAGVRLQVEEYQGPAR